MLSALFSSRCSFSTPLQYRRRLHSARQEVSGNKPRPRGTVSSALVFETRETFASFFPRLYDTRIKRNALPRRRSGKHLAFSLPPLDLALTTFLCFASFVAEPANKEPQGRAIIALMTLCAPDQAAALFMFDAGNRRARCELSMRRFAEFTRDKHCVLRVIEKIRAIEKRGEVNRKTWGRIKLIRELQGGILLEVGYFNAFSERMRVAGTEGRK